MRDGVLVMSTHRLYVPVAVHEREQLVLEGSRRQIRGIRGRVELDTVAGRDDDDFRDAALRKALQQRWYGLVGKTGAGKHLEGAGAEVGADLYEMFGSHG